MFRKLSPSASIYMSSLLFYLAATLSFLEVQAAGGIVIGSFHQEINATNYRDTFRTKLDAEYPKSGIELGVWSVKRTGSDLHRVVAYQSSDRNADPRALIPKLRDLGIKGSWYIKPEPSFAQFSPAPMIEPGSRNITESINNTDVTDGGPSRTNPIADRGGLVAQSNKNSAVMNDGETPDVDLPINGMESAPQQSIQGTSLVEGLELQPFVRLDHYRATGVGGSQVGADLRLDLAGGELRAAVTPDFFEQSYDQLLFNTSVTEPFFEERRAVLSDASRAFDTGGAFEKKIDRYFPLSTEIGRSPVSTILVNEATPTIRSVYTRRIGERFYYVNQAFNGELRLPTPKPNSSVDGYLFVDTGKRSLRYAVLGATENWINQRSFLDLSQRQEDKPDKRSLGIHSISFGQIPTHGFELTYTGAMTERSSFSAVNQELALFTENKSEKFSSLTRIFTSRRAGVDGVGAQTVANLKQGDSVSHRVEVTVMDPNINLNEIGFLSRNNFSEVSYSFAYAPQLSIDKLIFPLFGSKRPFAQLSIDNPGFNINLFQRKNMETSRIVGQGATLGGFLSGVNGERLFTNVGYFPARTDDLLRGGGITYPVEHRWWYELGVFTAPIGRTGMDLDLRIGQAQEYDSAWSSYLQAGISFSHADDFELRAGLDVMQRRNAVLRESGSVLHHRNYTSIRPSLNLLWHLTPSQTVSYDYQWLGVDFRPMANDQTSYQEHAQLVSQLRYNLAINRDLRFSLLYQYGIFPGVEPVPDDQSWLALYEQTIRGIAEENFLTARIDYLL